MKKILTRAKKLYPKSLYNATLLDFGCGSGWLSVGMAKNHVKSIGVDINKEYIKFSKERAKSENVLAHFILANGSYLPFSDNTFDYIIAEDVLEHVKDIRKCFKEISRVLKKNGYFHFRIPNKLYIFSVGHSNWKKQILMWIYKRKNYVPSWNIHKVTHFNYLPTYGNLIRLLKESDFNNSCFITPQKDSLSFPLKIVVIMLEKLHLLNWFKPGFTVIAEKRD